MITSLQKYNIFLIKESAKSLNDLDQIVLLENSTTKSIKLILYNYVTEDILAYIDASKMVGQDFWQIERISAEKGFGPLMYEILMMKVYPFGVKPSHVIKPKALNIWSYFLSNRSDVEKEQLKSNNKYFSLGYKHETDLEFKNDPESLNIINTVFYLQPNQAYNDLIVKSNNIIKEQQINRFKLFKKALDYFWYKYEY